MAELPDLGAIFRLPPARATEYLRAKGLRLSGPYWSVDGPEHSRVFTVANLAKLDVLADIQAAVQGAIDQGQTERWFRAQLVDTLKRKGWWGPREEIDTGTGEVRTIQQGSLRRLQTIYRTNLQNAYMAGRHRQALEQAARAPFAQYLAVRDSRSRPAHAALHGRVFRLDSAQWSVISPPNGYNCRCRARYLSQRELDRRGLKVEADTRLLEREPPGRRPLDTSTGETPGRWIQRGVSVPSRSGHGRETLWADVGWDHLPGGDGTERVIVDRLMRQADRVGDGMREVVVARLLEGGALAAPGQVDTPPASTWRGGAVCPGDPSGDLDHAERGCPGPVPAARVFDPARLLPPGRDDAWYVEQFLAPFGARIGQPALLRDVTGEPLLIGDALLTDRRKSANAGRPVYKVQKNGREVYLPLLAETILRPQEVWETVEWSGALQRALLRRRYLAWWQISGSEQPGLAVFEWSREWWAGVTTFPPSFAVAEDLAAYVNAQRQGIRRWPR